MALLRLCFPEEIEFIESFLADTFAYGVLPTKLHLRPSIILTKCEVLKFSSRLNTLKNMKPSSSL